MATEFDAEHHLNSRLFGLGERSKMDFDQKINSRLTELDRKLNFIAGLAIVGIALAAAVLAYVPVRSKWGVTTGVIVALVAGAAVGRTAEKRFHRIDQ